MTPEQRADGFLREVRAEMARQTVTIGRLAEAIDIDPGSLSRKLRGQTELKLIEALAISEALHTTAPTLLHRVDQVAVA